jgi:hypothetical protein
VEHGEGVEGSVFKDYLGSLAMCERKVCDSKCLYMCLEAKNRKMKENGFGSHRVSV